MGKINLLILDGDARYMDNLAGYIAGHYRHRFNLLTFSNSGVLLEYTQQKEAEADILLIAAEEYGDWVARLESGLVVLLARGSAGADYGGAENPLKQVDRYGGAEKIVSDLLKIYSNDERQFMEAGDIKGGRDNRISVVIATEGGAGKTSFAISLCSHFARLKLKSLYINLDYSGAGVFTPPEDGDGSLSDIVYTIKARPERLGIKLEALSKPAPGYGFSYYDPPVYPMDLDEILPADIETLIAKLRGLGIYDRVVIDTHNGLSLRNKTMMELVDSVFIVARGDASGISKIYQLKEQIDKSFGGQSADLYKRCQIILNRAGEGGTAQESSEKIAEAYSARVSLLPDCDTVYGDYGAEALAGISNSFSSSVADIARKS